MVLTSQRARSNGWGSVNARDGEVRHRIRTKHHPRAKSVRAVFSPGSYFEKSAFAVGVKSKSCEHGETAKKTGHHMGSLGVQGQVSTGCTFPSILAFGNRRMTEYTYKVKSGNIHKLPSKIQ